MPARLTSTSIAPKALRVAATASPHASSLPASVTMPVTRAPGTLRIFARVASIAAWSLSTSATRAPSSQNNSPVAAPSAAPPPPKKNTPGAPPCPPPPAVDDRTFARKPARHVRSPCPVLRYPQVYAFSYERAHGHRRPQHADRPAFPLVAGIAHQG